MMMNFTNWDPCFLSSVFYLSSLFRQKVLWCFGNPDLSEPGVAPSGAVRFDGSVAYITVSLFSELGSSSP
ncbi:unnamed protein product [Arctogadus glacialis]